MNDIQTHIDTRCGSEYWKIKMSDTNQFVSINLTRPMHLIQQLKLWKALDFSGESFFNCCKRLMHFFNAWSRNKL